MEGSGGYSVNDTMWTMEYGGACTIHHRAVFSLLISLAPVDAVFLFGGGSGAGIWARDTQSKTIT